LGYWCSKLKIPFYLTVHDYTTHIGEKNTWVEIIQKKTIQYAKKVIFLSQYEKDKAAQNGLAEGSCMVIQHPLLPVQTENTLKFNPKPKVLFVGRLKSYKGVDLLLESLQGLDYEYVTIAGEGKLPTTKTLDSRIKVLNYSLSEKEMNALLMTHEILVLPYKEASQSGILSLGINAHMVMVVSKVGGLPEQLQHNAAAWILPNSKDLKTALEKLIKNEAYYNELKSYIKTEKQRIIQNWKQDLSRLKNMLLDN
jgi:glycosyltransferase involved in cell wall biosynthesis